MSELADFLHKLIDAIDRPADHPAAELHQEVDAALAGEGEAPAMPEAEPTPEPDTQPSEAVPPDLAAQPPAPEPSADQGFPAPEPPVDG